MPPEDAIRLQHMLDAANEAIVFSRGMARSDLDKNRMLVLALVKEIEIIGEAAYQISQELRDQIDQVPWDDIVAMRHRLVHAYFDINLDILWQTIQDDLPSLITALESPQLGD